MIVVVDTFDSFTYNLVQLLAATGAEVEVVRNDRISVDAVLGGGWDAIVISPGPGRPEESGITVPLVRAAAGRVPCWGSASATRRSGTRGARRSSARGS